jgi:putative membrane protein
MESRRHFPQAILAGTVAGLAASWAMSEFQAWWSRKADGVEPRSAGGRHDARDWQERYEGQNANELVAEWVAEQTIDRPLARKELAVAAPAVHYAFGATMGAVYGGIVEAFPRVPVLSGAAWGSSVWIGADELAVPLLGLARRDVDYPVEAHLQSFTAHLVYGLTTELVYRAVRPLLGGSSNARRSRKAL